MVCTQRIGDVLLATPLAHSLKSAWPGIRIDFLVLPGTQGILEGNPDVEQTLVFPQRVGWREKVAQLARVWRRYDLAIAATPTDRARIFAWAASARSLGFVTDEKRSWAQRLLLDIAIPFDNLHTHTVSSGLALVSQLGIPALARVQPPRQDPIVWSRRKQQLGLDRIGAYAVIHANPKFRYKMWDIAKWAQLVSALRQQGLEVVLTASPDPEESAYVQEIAGQVGEGCTCLCGQLSLAETAELLRDARIFIGPDTAVTHLAAATGIPTIALFGPSNPTKWAPWPVDHTALESPWAFIGSKQSGNVWLIQGEGDCVPCLLEGCDRHLNSASKCLQEISVARVLLATREALEAPGAWIRKAAKTLGS